MIASLIDSLQALAAPADVQLARYPDFTVKADELALEFEDALLLVTSCQQIGMDDEQRDTLCGLDDLLTRMSGKENSRLWTEDALRSAPEWEEVRRRAAATLRSLGFPVEPPPPTSNTYIGPPGT